MKITDSGDQQSTNEVHFFNIITHIDCLLSAGQSPRKKNSRVTQQMDGINDSG